MFKSLTAKLETAKVKLQAMINRKASRRLIATQIIRVERLEYQIEQELKSRPMLGQGRLWGWGKHLRNERIRNRENITLQIIEALLSNFLTQYPEFWIGQKDISQSDWEIKVEVLINLSSLRGTLSQLNWATNERAKRLMGLPVDRVWDFFELSEMVMAKNCSFWLDTRFLSNEVFLDKMTLCLQGYHGFAHEVRRVA